MRRYALLTLVLLFLAALGLGGCLVPNQFVADLELNPDGTYRFTYAGDMVYDQGIAKLAKGEIESDDEMFAALLAQINELGTMRAAYKGDGVYTVTIDEHGEMVSGSRIRVPQGLGYIAIYWSKKSGDISLRSFPPGRDVIATYQKYGIQGRGTLCIKTTEAVKILRSNAHHREGGCLTWDIDVTGDSYVELLVNSRL